MTADANGRALVVDIDPQSSSAEMAGQMEDPGFDFSHQMDPVMLVRLRELRGYDMVFIDCPGSLEGGQILEAVLAVSDFAWSRSLTIRWRPGRQSGRPGSWPSTACRTRSC